MEIAFAAINVISQTFAKIFPVTIALGIVFAALTHIWPCNDHAPWWRKKEIVTDIVYWFAIPLMARVVRIGLLVVGAAMFYDIKGGPALIAFYNDGFGPLAAMPLWAQAIVFLVVSDFLLYWFHRMFHEGVLWKYHAVHHSSEEVDWISAARFHPFNIVFGSVLVDVGLLLAGISPNVMLLVGPFTIAHSAFVHANLNWTLGPLRYVIATPIFHRWHHTYLAEGGMTNYAGTFPIWDILFGTWRMPQGQVPEVYGAEDPAMPMSFTGQMSYPFRQSA